MEPLRNIDYYSRMQAARELAVLDPTPSNTSRYLGKKYGGWPECGALIALHLMLQVAIAPSTAWGNELLQSIARLAGHLSVGAVTATVVAFVSIFLTRQIIISLLIGQVVWAVQHGISLFSRYTVEFYAMSRTSGVYQPDLMDRIYEAALWRSSVVAAIPLVPIILYLPAAMLRTRRR